MKLTQGILEIEEKIKASVEKLRPLRNKLEEELADCIANEETKKAIDAVMDKLNTLYKERQRLVEQLKDSPTPKGE